MKSPDLEHKSVLVSKEELEGVDTMLIGKLTHLFEDLESDDKSHNEDNHLLH